jgi:hypothetical protein
MNPYTVKSSNGIGGVLGHKKPAFVVFCKKRKKKNIKQTGGMFPGLILRAILAKKRKQNVGKAVGDYLKRGTSARIAVAKSVAQKKVPTPGNTGMSAKNFFMSGLFGIG